MDFKEARARLDGHVEALVGRRLSSVSYFELRYDGFSGPSPNRDPDFDSVDFGLELQLDSGVSCWVTWGTEFYTYALRVEINTPEDRSRMGAWDVSRISRWRNLVGRKITDAQIYWDWQALGAHPARWGPQDLELTFENGAVTFVSSLQIEPGHAPFGHTNNVTVIFDEQVARRYRVGPFAKMPNRIPGA